MSRCLPRRAQRQYFHWHPGGVFVGTLLLARTWCESDNTRSPAPYGTVQHLDGKLISKVRRYVLTSIHFNFQNHGSYSHSLLAATWRNQVRDSRPTVIVAFCLTLILPSRQVAQDGKHCGTRGVLRRYAVTGQLLVYRL